MEIIDAHTHWGPSATMGIEVTTRKILHQAEQGGVDRIVVFPFPSRPWRMKPSTGNSWPNAIASIGLFPAVTFRKISAKSLEKTGSTGGEMSLDQGHIWIGYSFWGHEG